jgi:predicted transglutaminase-like cysteine proteinase
LIRLLLILLLLAGCAVTPVEMVHRDVNRSIRYFDKPGWNWQPPLEVDGILYGDCTTYVLEKKKRLDVFGIDSEIMVVYVKDNKYHAVLRVGDLILDNNYSSAWHINKWERRNEIF